jgi:hypothetical protein
MSCVCRCANSVLTKARVVARSATARQNSLTNRSGRAHIWQTKCHRQTNLRSILEQLPRSGQISASSEETKSSQSKRLFIRIPIFQCPIRGDVLSEGMSYQRGCQEKIFPFLSERETHVVLASSPISVQERLWARRVFRTDQAVGGL